MHKPSHPTPHVAQTLHDAEHVADVGASEKTPLILFGEVWVICAVAVLVFLAIALLAYRVAS